MISFGFLAAPPRPLLLAQVLCAVGFVLAFWRHGITIDLVERKVHVWRGPMFRLLSETYPLSEYAFVSLMEDSVEIFDKKPFQIRRSYSTSLGLKLQPLLSPDTPFPEDLPPVLTLRSFGRRRREKARRMGRDLAVRLELPFRDDA